MSEQVSTLTSTSELPERSLPERIREARRRQAEEQRAMRVVARHAVGEPRGVSPLPREAKAPLPRPGATPSKPSALTVAVGAPPTPGPSHAGAAPTPLGVGGAHATLSMEATSLGGTAAVDRFLSTPYFADTRRKFTVPIVGDAHFQLEQRLWEEWVAFLKAPRKVVEGWEAHTTVALPAPPVDVKEFDDVNHATPRDSDGLREESTVDSFAMPLPPSRPSIASAKAYCDELSSAVEMICQQQRETAAAEAQVTVQKKTERRSKGSKQQSNSPRPRATLSTAFVTAWTRYRDDCEATLAAVVSAYSLKGLKRFTVDEIHKSRGLTAAARERAANLLNSLQTPHAARTGLFNHRLLLDDCVAQYGSVHPEKTEEFSCEVTFDEPNATTPYTATLILQQLVYHLLSDLRRNEVDGAAARLLQKLSAPSLLGMGWWEHRRRAWAVSIVACPRKSFEEYYSVRHHTHLPLLSVQLAMKSSNVSRLDTLLPIRFEASAPRDVAWVSEMAPVDPQGHPIHGGKVVQLKLRIPCDVILACALHPTNGAVADQHASASSGVMIDHLPCVDNRDELGDTSMVCVTVMMHSQESHTLNVSAAPMRQMQGVTSFVHVSTIVLRPSPQLWHVSPKSDSGENHDEAIACGTFVSVTESFQIRRGRLISPRQRVLQHQGHRVTVVVDLAVDDGVYLIIADGQRLPLERKAVVGRCPLWATEGGSRSAPLPILPPLKALKRRPEQFLNLAVAGGGCKASAVWRFVVACPAVLVEGPMTLWHAGALLATWIVE